MRSCATASSKQNVSSNASRTSNNTPPVMKTISSGWQERDWSNRFHSKTTASQTVVFARDSSAHRNASQSVWLNLKTRASICCCCSVARSWRRWNDSRKRSLKKDGFMRHTVTHEKPGRALELFTNIPRRRLITFNTPVERLERLQRAIPGAPQLWIKRDDLTGYLGGGNKLRKLEYVFADAAAHGATTIVTTGSITSNLARTAALIARRLGLKCELILSGRHPKSAHANWRVTELLGIKIHRVAAGNERASRMREVAQELEARGERVYQIPLGASNEIGSFGMVAAFEELGIQQLELGEQFDAVVFATSSGGTQA